MTNIGTRLYSLFEGVKIAFDALRTNKVRAGLTILGIAVGVFVVTVMSAAVHGINEGVSSSLAAAGPNTFFITKWPAEINRASVDTLATLAVQDGLVTKQPDVAALLPS